MEYRIARDGQTFGPYTEDELRQYLASGNIVESDLARSDAMTDWQPLRKVLPKQKKPKRGTLNPAGLRKDLPSPPDMPWWIALALEVLTELAFFVAWDIVEAVWLCWVQKRSHAIWYYSLAALLFLLNLPAIYSSIRHFSLFSPFTHSTQATWLTVAVLAARLVGRFSMRRSLLQHFNGVEPIGLKLSWLWTLLFGGLYFQYQFNRINALKRAAANPPIAPSAAR